MLIFAQKDIITRTCVLEVPAHLVVGAGLPQCVGLSAVIHSH